ncbi:MAG TPA: NAD(P)H-hydrate epimerase [Hyphomicrobiales bacterium]|nr:NAD(P)H-hydrate epimerase [Hyphomicrobiales bacterium]
MAKASFYTAAQCRELDRLAVEDYGVPNITLMQRAAEAAFNALRQQWPDATALEIFCGIGNNGGDGFITGMLAQKAGLRPHIHIVGDASRIAGDALKALQLASSNQVPLDGSAVLASSEPGTVIVDAMLGTGLHGEVRAPYREAIATINASGLPVLALDVPSGLCSDTGAVLGNAVRADLTITFVGRKLGLARGQGPAHAGKVVFASLDLPQSLYKRVPGTTQA